MKKYLMKGNEAIAEAAIQAGCRFYFGYPITPSTEIIEYMAQKMQKVGGTFLQAESEIAAIYMVFGAAGAGKRVMTASSSIGISLKQEGISFLAANELPAVIVNIMRTGPGLGGLGPSQADYFQAVKGGGHGDYRLIVLAPSSVQEMADLIMDGFDLADLHRNPVMILADGILGQMMEPVVFHNRKPIEVDKSWATTGAKDRPRNMITSYNLQNEAGEAKALYLENKYKGIKEREQRWEVYRMEDAEYVFVAYGTSARIVKGVVDTLREEDHKVGLIRPITLWPFPEKAFTPIIQKVKGYMVVEMSAGQMVEDVKLNVNGAAPVAFYSRQGGITPQHDEMKEKFYQSFDVRGMRI
ncbi:3-methyl-2-oxobutanoate dehydrogenase subunit VorB [Tepidibacillus sp. HK-1]|uniref:3-methyl-2-oxobutanoate dehydrogenase subunit VorB n=1 Tax=Tepidibacillus sp. HK-1 TaxID=1883407 RepID=UPI0008531444|nr:3-methyl-2-oxobutanoate dehydrogenase subunit VorB [Tepidibacillus sp. HK-1]GBF12589.1 pyruvate synthase subunit PorA [Tepidibacillus sp. HK-1]